MLVDRCEDAEAGALCQLASTHEGLHAAAVGDAFLTWQFGEVFRWRKYPAPHWLIELPWVPGLQPLPDHHDVA
jgi:hypothetical protein